MPVDVQSPGPVHVCRCRVLRGLRDGDTGRQLPVRRPQLPVFREIPLVDGLQGGRSLQQHVATWPRSRAFPFAFHRLPDVMDVVVGPFANHCSTDADVRRVLQQDACGETLVGIPGDGHLVLGSRPFRLPEVQGDRPGLFRRVVVAQDPGEAADVLDVVDGVFGVRCRVDVVLVLEAARGTSPSRKRTRISSTREPRQHRRFSRPGRVSLARQVMPNPPWPGTARR